MAPKEYVSKSFRTAFRNWCSGYSSLRQIQEVFQDAGDFMPDSSRPVAEHITGERRTLVEQFYNTIDFSDPLHVRRFLAVVSLVLAQQEAGAPGYGQLVAACKNEGLEVAGRQVLLKQSLPTDWLDSAKAIFDREHFAIYCDRMKTNVDSDPSAAIGAAKELVESVCKYVLRAAGTPAMGDEALPALAKKALAALNLTPEAIPDTKRGAESMKKVLGAMATTVHGLAELRNLYGTGHGRDGALRGLRPRHAKLAVGAATTLCTFMLETSEELRVSTKAPSPEEKAFAP